MDHIIIRLKINSFSNKLQLSPVHAPFLEVALSSAENLFL